MQLLVIAGNVGKGGELRTTQSGDKVLGFSLAVDNGKDRNGNKRPATWYDCSLWGKRAEALAPHIRKGDKLTLTGRPSARAHDGKAYLGISVNDLTFQGGKPDNHRSPTENPGAPASGGGYGGAPASALDDEIPFAAIWWA